MPRVTIEQLTQQSKITDRIRNICIIAHVDHGDSFNTVKHLKIMN